MRGGEERDRRGAVGQVGRSGACGEQWGKRAAVGHARNGVTEC